MVENKVSFIISTLNSGRTLEKCLLSIISQSYKNFEIIIIDGNSIDNTIEIINKYSSHLAYFISESDKGIYDAWNKALNHVKGNWVCFIGSDDVILRDAILEMFSILPNNETNFISAKVMLVDENGKDINEIGRPWNFMSLKKGLGIVHCGALHASSLFEFELFDSSYKIAGDFEFLLRNGRMINAIYLDKVIVKMFNGGSSRKFLKQVIFETYRALYNSKNVSKLEANLYYLNAHIREIIKFAIMKVFGRTIFEKIRKLTTN